MNQSILPDLVQIKKIFEDKLNHTIEENFYLEEEGELSDTLKNVMRTRIINLFDTLLEEQLFSDGIGHIIETDLKQLDHSINTAIYTGLIAVAMYFDDQRLRTIFSAALLHDIGKTTHCKEKYPDIKDHTACAVAFLGDREERDEQMLRMIAEHHEKADGTGIPNHLAKEQMLLESRVIALADHYDYFLNRASNLFARSGETSKIEGFFGADLTLFLRKRFVPYPLATLVRLSDHRIGVVEKQNPKDLFRPVIKIVRQVATKIIIDEVDLSLEKELMITEVLKETPNPSVQSYLVKGYN